MGLGSRHFKAAVERSARQPRRGAMFIVMPAGGLRSSVSSGINLYRAGHSTPAGLAR